MAADVQIGLVEFERARDEIDKRTELSANLINYEIVLVGVLLSASASMPREALVVGACVSCIFWLMWIDHTSQIYKIAGYIGVRLAPRLRAADSRALGWELFLRQLDEGGAESATALGIEAQGARMPFLHTSGINRYILLLFLGGALALSLAYLSAALDEQWRLVWLALPGFLMVYGLLRSRQLSRTSGAISDAILSRDRMSARATAKAE